jgi:2-succinyl-5-enolpyruvyl-6-hydroxy-3-cyclohexene-1-carboxylate synthase
VINALSGKSLSLPSLSEDALFHHWDTWLPAGWALFLGNSQPIRQISEVAMASGRPMLAIGHNRGASGIDGLIATAGGFMSGYDRPGILILGDLSFLHDVSSLPLVANKPLLILVIQNNGGEIFSRFSVKNHPCFTDFFHLTHTHSCAAAGQWALGYTKRVGIGDAIAEIHDATSWIQASGRAALLEVVVNQS